MPNEHNFVCLKAILIHMFSLHLDILCLDITSE
jgi:hypothetical protein